jgi:hypothetical protein
MKMAWMRWERVKSVWMRWERSEISMDEMGEA